MWISTFFKRQQKVNGIPVENFTACTVRKIPFTLPAWVILPNTRNLPTQLLPDGTCIAYQPYGEAGVVIADIDIEKATGLLVRRFKPELVL